VHPCSAQGGAHALRPSFTDGNSSARGVARGRPIALDQTEHLLIL
jgi:hypothetical protein